MTTDPDPQSRRPFFLSLLACGLLTLTLGLATQPAASHTRRPDGGPAANQSPPDGDAPAAPRPIPGG